MYLNTKITKDRFNELSKANVNPISIDLIVEINCVNKYLIFNILFVNFFIYHVSISYNIVVMYNL